MSDVAGYYRHPTIHGDTIVFVCEDDLWSVPAAGGVARRLTASAGICSFPRFSPDGRSIAFTAREEGPAEAYVVEADGGAPRRLTSFGSLFTITAGWKPDGASVVVATDAGQPFRGYAHLHIVPLAGGPSEAARFGPARAFAFDPDSRGLAIGRNSGDPARWKRYRGGTAGTLWIDREGKGDFAPLVKLDGNLANPMWFGGRVYFLADHEGHGNLYSVLPDGKDVRRHTDHEDFYVRFPSADEAGRRIVYGAGADLYVFDAASGASRRVDVRLKSPRAQRQRKFVPAAKDFETFDLHPAGHSTALVTRGAVHAMGLFDGPVTRVAGVSGTRARLARWLPDGKRLVGVSDEGGEEAVTVWTADGSTPPHRIAADVGRALDLVVAPAGGDRVALANHRQELVVVDLAAGTATVADRSLHDRIDGVAWSPDGRFVAYGFSNSRRTSHLRLVEVATGIVTHVTRPDFRDGQPAFDPDGKYLYFVSHRIFDPVYDAHYFDLGFPKGSKPFLIPLAKDAPSPFSSTTRAPKPLVPAAASAPDASKVSADAKPDLAAVPAGRAPLRIDLDGIADRVVAFPVPEGKYLKVAGSPGRALFLSWPVEGSLGADWRVGGEPEAKGLLESWDFDADKVATVVAGVTSFSTSLDGKVLGVRVGHRLRALAATAVTKDLSSKDEAGRESGWLDLGRVRVAVVPGDEWKQMYREAWRLQRDHFWTADMSGIDWRGIFDRYAPLVGRAGTRAEFSDLMWEMQGELATSHCYEMGGDYRPEPQWHVGFLGADLAFDRESGAWKIARIPRGDSWEASKASPLSAPGLGIAEGDAVVAVDGEPVGPDAPPSARLVHQAGRDVALTISTPGGERRTVAVRTLRDETGLRYRDWVETNRAKVHAASGGKLGYVHVPNMGPIGFAEFHRSYGAEVDHEGLVIDVRWNGGGHVSQLLLEKLLRRRVSYNQSRWMAIGPYPDDAPMGPMVALTNEYAGSDGDIFSHSWKLFRLGPLIGKRTWGGVVGIWPRHALIDGTLTTQPEFAFWFTDVGWAVEGHGTDPDIEVENRPQDHTKGVDVQLDRAIAEALALVAREAPKIPDLATARPMRKPPTLPKRG